MENHNKKVKINFHQIAKETGVKKGRIFHSPTLGWVISGHPDISLIKIEPPHKIGEILDGKIIDKIKIESNHWVFYLT